MDELVFLRETLRRTMLQCAEQLEKAAAAYDPEDLPTEDVVAVFQFVGAGEQARKYTELVAHRLEERAK